MNELISDNAEQRAFTSAAMNTLQCSFWLPATQILAISRTDAPAFLDTTSAWVPLVWFQQVHQPNVRSGNIAAAVVTGFTVIVFILITILAHREEKQKKLAGLLKGPSETGPASLGDGSNHEKVSLSDEEDILPVLEKNIR